MCVGHLVMASAVTGSLYVGSIILGVCYGAQWSLMPAITSEIFGLRHFGTLFNTIGIASPVGAYILSVRVAGYLYDQEAEWQHRDPKIGDDDPLSCHGPSCFRLTFLILACVCALGCAVCVWLFVRTKRFYQELHNRLHKNDWLDWSALTKKHTDLEDKLSWEKIRGCLDHRAVNWHRCVLIRTFYQMLVDLSMSTGEWPWLWPQAHLCIETKPIV